MLRKLNKFRVILTVIVISLFLSSICIFSGCEKYKDGPKISFRSRTERVANTWKFSKYIQNDSDQTAQKSAYVLTLTKDNYATLTTNDAAGDIYGGTWRFKQTTDMNAKPVTYSYNKDSLEIYIYSGFDNISGVPPFIAFSYDCNILELKQNNMHLQGNYTYTYPGIMQPDTTIAGTFDWTLTKK